MRWLTRRKTRLGRPRTADPADLKHLTEFVRTHPGVEAYLEPQTTVTATTVVLVAATGEWTRRRVAGERGAAAFAEKQRIPLYDVGAVGYPERMRRWNARHKEDGNR